MRELILRCRDRLSAPTVVDGDWRDLIAQTFDDLRLVVIENEKAVECANHDPGDEDRS